MNSVFKLSIGVLAIGIGSSAATARSPINMWLCKSLSSTSFDPKAVIAAFPLEKMPIAIETREERTNDDGRKTTNVEVESEGENYTITYDYAFKNDDVTDPYGFDLTIRANYKIGKQVGPQMQQWLAEMGKPERNGMGWQSIFSGPPIYEGGDPAFELKYRPTLTEYSAHWWRRGDIRHAANICK